MRATSIDPFTIAVSSIRALIQPGGLPRAAHMHVFIADESNTDQTCHTRSSLCVAALFIDSGPARIGKAFIDIVVDESSPLPLIRTHREAAETPILR